MGILTQLDVVNDMLGALGEVSLNSLVNAPPLATSGLNMLRKINSREQAKGWWFNTETIRLNPTADKRIIVPDDVLKIDPIEPQLNYAQRGKFLYKLNAAVGSSPYHFDHYVDVQVVRLLPFEDLPASAQDFISISAQKDFVTDMDGDRLKIDELKQDRREAWLTLNAEHIRAVDANLLRNPSTAATLNSLRGPVSTGLRFR